MGARYFGIGQETTYGTAVAPTRFFEALSESVEKKMDFESVETIRAYSPVDLALLKYRVEGDVEVLANYDGIGLVLKHLLGSGETASTTTPYTWTFPTSAGVPSTDKVGLGLTLRVRRSDALYWNYAGAKITGMRHSFGTDQSSRMNFSFLAKTESTSTTSTASIAYSTLRPMKPSHVTVKFDGGAELAARSATIEVQDPHDQPFGLGSTTFVAEPDRSGVRKVTGSVEVLYTDNTEFAKFDGSTVVDVEIKATDGTYSITYNANKCRLTQATPHLRGRERLAATYTFESYFDATATENLQAILITTDATLT